MHQLRTLTTSPSHTNPVVNPNSQHAALPPQPTTIRQKNLPITTTSSTPYAFSLPTLRVPSTTWLGNMHLSSPSHLTRLLAFRHIPAVELHSPNPLLRMNRVREVDPLSGSPGGLARRAKEGRDYRIVRADCAMHDKPGWEVGYTVFFSCARELGWWIWYGMLR